MTTTPQPPTATVTTAALAELERLALAATPGPWKWELHDTPGLVTFEHEKYGTCIIARVENWYTNAAYIAAACNAVPSLVAQLRAEIAAREAAEGRAAWLEMTNKSLNELYDIRGQRILEDADAAEAVFQSLSERAETAERERDEARQRATEAERERVDACQLVASLPRCDCGHIFPMHTADGCADCAQCAGYTHGAPGWPVEDDLHASLRQRAERAEADAAELRACVRSLLNPETSSFSEWFDAKEQARALLARTSAERKDGGERVA